MYDPYLVYYILCCRLHNIAWVLQVIDAMTAAYPTGRNAFELWKACSNGKWTRAIEVAKQVRNRPRRLSFRRRLNFWPLEKVEVLHMIVLMGVGAQDPGACALAEVRDGGFHSRGEPGWSHFPLQVYTYIIMGVVFVAGYPAWT
jgi:hypothetical protein